MSYTRQELLDKEKEELVAMIRSLEVKIAENDETVKKAADILLRSVEFDFTGVRIESDDIVVDFEGVARYDGFYKNRSTAVQSQNDPGDESYVEFTLEDTYGKLEDGKAYRIIVVEVEL